MKKILILQMRPENETADSEFEAFLRIGKIEREHVHRIRVEQLEQPEKFEIDLGHFCAIIAGGSPFDVSNPVDKKSTAQKQIETFFTHLFDQVIANDFPFLGVCSGNGLLGSYCGVKISTRYGEAVEGLTVEVTEEGEKDALLYGLPKRFKAFVGHKEACDSVPLNAVLLATSGPCPVQMFRVKNNIYATQFHPEADAEEFILRINIYKNYGYFPPEKADEIIASIRGIETPFSNEILKRFVKKYYANEA